MTVVTSDGAHRLEEMVIAEGFDVVAESGPVVGQLLDAFTRRAWPQVSVTILGVVTEEADGQLSTTAFDVEDGKITAIYSMRNPDKLRHLH